MNYIIAFCVCAAGTLLSAVKGGGNVHLLVVSDLNVSVCLTIAWYLDKHRPKGQTPEACWYKSSSHKVEVLPPMETKEIG